MSVTSDAVAAGGVPTQHRCQVRSDPSSGSTRRPSGERTARPGRVRPAARNTTGPRYPQRSSSAKIAPVTL
jgi:hypothetical protein